MAETAVPIPTRPRKACAFFSSRIRTKIPIRPKYIFFWSDQRDTRFIFHESIIVRTRSYVIQHNFTAKSIVFLKLLIFIIINNNRIERHRNLLFNLFIYRMFDWCWRARIMRGLCALHCGASYTSSIHPIHISVIF